MEDAVVVKNLSVQFTGTEFQLHPVSFQLKQGEMAAIVGESGCGKSTLSKALVRMNDENAAVSGTVIINGKVLYQMADKNLQQMRMKEFAIAFQNSETLFNPLLSIGGHLNEVLKKSYEKKELQVQMESLLDLVGLDRTVLSKLPGELSGGMLQRVLIISAIALRPAFVILDEPTSALDEENQEKILQLIEKVNREYQTTFLIITHDFRVARRLCSKLFLFYHGYLVEEGEIDSILETPAHPYSRGLLNASMDLYPLKDIWGIQTVEQKMEVRAEGCPFFDRCPQHLDSCRTICPTLSKHKNLPNRKVACNRGGIVTVLAGEHIYKSYGNHVVLKEQSLSIDSAEIVSLVGKSGCGKSTMANILAGYLDADAGKIIFCDETADYNKLLRMKNGIQMVFQDPERALNPYFTVEEAVSEALRLTEKKKDCNDAVCKSLMDVGLPSDASFLKKQIRFLSGGQKQRVLLARALTMEPVVLIADEITSMLDASSKANMIRLLKGIQNTKGMAMLFITHDLICARKISDKIYLMNDQGHIKRNSLFREIEL